MWKADLHIDKLYRSAPPFTQPVAQALQHMLSQEASTYVETLRKILVNNRWELLNTVPEDAREDVKKALQHHQGKPLTGDDLKNIVRSLCRRSSSNTTGVKVSSPPWTKSAADQMFETLQTLADDNTPQEKVRWQDRRSKAALTNALISIIQKPTLLHESKSKLTAENKELAESIVNVHKTRMNEQGRDINIIGEDMFQTLQRFRKREMQKEKALLDAAINAIDAEDLWCDWIAPDAKQADAAEQADAEQADAGQAEQWQSYIDWDKLDKQESKRQRA